MQRIEPGPGMFVEAGQIFGTRDNGGFYLLHLPHCAEWPPAAAWAGKERRCDEPRPRHVGERLSRGPEGKPPGLSLDRYQNPSPGASQRRDGSHWWKKGGGGGPLVSRRRRTNVGPGATGGLVGRHCPSPLLASPPLPPPVADLQQRPRVRQPGLRPLSSWLPGTGQAIHSTDGVPRRAELETLCSQPTIPVDGNRNLSRAKALGHERAVQHIIRVNDYAAHTSSHDSVSVYGNLSSSFEQEIRQRHHQS